MSKNRSALKVTLTVVLVLSGVYGYYFWKKKGLVRASAPSREEFFRRNPHLVRSEEKVTPEPDVMRSNDTFQPGDYQLKAGKTYPIDFAFEMDSKSQGKVIVKQNESGRARLRSYGIEKGRLVVLLDFTKTASQTKVESKPAKPGKKQLRKQPSLLDRSVLLKLDPRGILREMFVSKPFSDLNQLDFFLKLTDVIFRKIEPLATGRRTQIEGDPQDRPYQVSYEMALDSKGDWAIKFSADKEADAFNKKSGLVASSDLSSINLKTIQGMKQEWVWSAREQRPLSQRAEGFSEIRMSEQQISYAGAKAGISWGDALDTPAPDERREKLKYAIDIRRVRILIAEASSNNGKRNAKGKGFLKSWKHVVNDLEKLKNRNLSEQEATEIYNDVSNRVAADDSLVGSVKLMAMAEPGSRKASMAIGALGFNGGEQAQNALLDIYQQFGNTAQIKDQVLTELATSPRPLTPETKKFLKETYQGKDVFSSSQASIAGLALGTAIALDGDPELVNFFHEEWNQASAQPGSAAEKRGYLLSAMGNSKSDVFLDEVKIAADDSNPHLRAHAADAVRFAQDDPSRNILFEVFMKDRSPSVRQMAAASLLYQPWDNRTRTALLDCSAGDSDHGVRLTCYRALTNHADQPEIRQYLEQQSKAEKDSQIKDTILKALSVLDEKK